MKTKINVTVEEEEQLKSQIDDDKIKDILTKLKNNRSVFLTKKPFTTMIIKDDKIQLKKGKWFKKFKSISLINIEQSFILENCQELILLLVNTGKFSGYIVLRITIASNLLDFIDILNKVLNHHHTIIQKGSGYYGVDDEIKDNTTTEIKPILIEPVKRDLDNDNNDKPSDNDMVDSSFYVVNGKENEENKSLKGNDNDPNNTYEVVDRNINLRISTNTNEPNDNNEVVESNINLRISTNTNEPNTYEVVERNNILRISTNTNETTYLNNNSRESYINDSGPIALFSVTFPSTNTIDNCINNCVDDSDSESESDSHSENGHQIM